MPRNLFVSDLSVFSLFFPFPFFCVIFIFSFKFLSFICVICFHVVQPESSHSSWGFISAVCNHQIGPSVREVIQNYVVIETTYVCISQRLINCGIQWNLNLSFFKGMEKQNDECGKTINPGNYYTL